MHRQIAAKSIISPATAGRLGNNSRLSAAPGSGSAARLVCEFGDVAVNRIYVVFTRCHVFGNVILRMAAGFDDLAPADALERSIRTKHEPSAICQNRPAVETFRCLSALSLSNIRGSRLMKRSMLARHPVETPLGAYPQAMPCIGSENY
jgi:hypothetical protein